MVAAELGRSAALAVVEEPVDGAEEGPAVAKLAVAGPVAGALVVAAEKTDRQGNQGEVLAPLVPVAEVRRADLDWE